ncbi:MAG: hypothetical protein LLF92_09485 [Planctomycetaceae bacterium]|nr:hypothetical protein [Planctomycetaceae bacterium]
MYDWKLYYHFPNLILWGILLACLVLKENRNLRAYLVLLPILSVCALWGIIRQILPAFVSQSNILTHIVSTLMLSAAILWLMLDRLARYKLAVSFFLSIVLLSMVGIISMFVFGGFSFSSDVISIFIMQFAWAVSLVCGILIARYFCRKGFSGKVFSLWLLLWMIVVFDVMMFFIMLVTLASSGYLMRNLFILIFVPIQGTTAGLMAYVFTLPYLILTFKCEFYRKRFLAWLRLTEPAKENDFSMPYS